LTPGRLCVTPARPFVGEWLSLVEHLVRDQGVAGSNPVSPTNLRPGFPWTSEVRPGTDSYLAACIAGLGIIQAPRSGMLPSIATADLVEVLRQHTCEPLPVSLVHAHGRTVPRHVRAVMNWIAQLFTPHLH
jgi:DNA-binding transcriptional LysR family regulator